MSNLSVGLEGWWSDGLEERSKDGTDESVRLSSSSIILAMFGDECDRDRLEPLDDRSLSSRSCTFEMRVLDAEERNNKISKT